MDSSYRWSNESCVSFFILDECVDVLVFSNLDFTSTISSKNVSYHCQSFFVAPYQGFYHDFSESAELSFLTQCKSVICIWRCSPESSYMIYIIPTNSFMAMLKAVLSAGTTICLFASSFRTLTTLTQATEPTKH